MSNPTTHVEQFDDSPGSFSTSGAIRYNDGMWLVSEARNLWASTSGTVENGAGTWGDYGTSPGVTVAWTQSGDWAVGGTKSLKCVMTCDDANADQSARSALITGLSESESYCIRSVIKRVTPEIRADLDVQWRSDVGNIGGEVVIASIQSGTAAGVTEISALLTSPAGTTNARFIWRIRLSQAGVAHTCYMDNHAIIPSAWIEEYFDGSSGDGFSWDGAAFASASTRAASSASVATAGILSPDTGSLAFRFRRLIDTGGTETLLECGTAGSGTDYLSISVNSSDKLVVSWNSDNAGAQTVTSTESIAVDTEYFVYTEWASGTMGLSIDNGDLVVGARDAVEGDWGVGELVLEAT